MTASRLPLLRGLDLIVRIACWIVFLVTAFVFGTMIPGLIDLVSSGGP